MRSLLKEHGAEALIGLFVVLIAVWFAYYAWGRTGGGRAANAIRVTAQFPNVAGVNIGTDVRVAGMKIGRVVAQHLAHLVVVGDLDVLRDALVASGVELITP